MAFAPYLEAAALAAPRPPLPPPITRKSVSLEMGAMLITVDERCLEMVPMRPDATVLDDRTGRLAKIEIACIRMKGNSGYRLLGGRGIAG